MTFKELFHWTDSKGYLSASERYHSPPWHGSSGHGGSWKSKGGSGAAISALALLAFLFFLNTMQQTMMNNIMMNAMGNMETPTILLKTANDHHEENIDATKINNFHIENDNTFWNTQRLEIDASNEKKNKNN